MTHNTSSTSPKILILARPDNSIVSEFGCAGLAGGYEILWYTPSHADYWKHSDIIPIPGATGYTFPFRWIPKLAPLIETLYLCYLIIRTKPELIHVFMAEPRIYNLILHLCKPVIVTVMGADIFHHGKRRLFLRDILLKHAQYITSRSDFIDQTLLAIGDYKHKIKRNTWGVDCEKFKPGLPTYELHDRLGIPPQVPVFFSMRGCSGFYRHHIVLQAFAIFIKQGYNNAFLIVNTWQGEQEYIDLLESLAQKYKIVSNVRFVNSIPRRLMPFYCNLATSAISIPPSDGMPQSLYETMACGCFHILGDLPQYKELIEHKSNGFYVTLDDPEALANAMQWVVEHPEILREAAEYNRKKILEIADKNQQITLFNELYHEVIQRKKHTWYHKYL